MKEFLSQGQDSSCVAVAIVNACIYAGRKPPHMEDLITDLKCKHGGAIGEDTVIDEVFEGRMRKTDCFDEFMEEGGILTINHPIFNFHAICVFPQDDGQFTLVNSWLGPNVLKNIGREEIERFLPKYQSQLSMWTC